MNGCELISFITALACSMIQCFPDDDLELLAAAFTQLADTLATYLTQKSIKESKNDDDTCNNKNESKNCNDTSNSKNESKYNNCNNNHKKDAVQ